MKILVNKVDVVKADKIKESKIICPHCGSELVFENNDETYWAIGGEGFDCPCCNKFIVIKKGTPIDFPNAFYHFGQSENCVKIPDEEIQEWIKEGIKKLEEEKENLEDWVWYTGSGDTFVTIFRYDGSKEYEINVSKNYWSTDVDFDTIKKIFNN